MRSKPWRKRSLAAAAAIVALVYFSVQIMFHIKGPCRTPGCLPPAASDGAALLPFSVERSADQQQQQTPAAVAAAAITASFPLAYTLDDQGHFTILNLDHVLAYPHVDECRQCKVCIPQSIIDQQLGNSSSSSSGFGHVFRLWRGHRQKRKLLHWHNSSARLSSRPPWYKRQQHWTAAAAAIEMNPTEYTFSNEHKLPSIYHQQQQQQQQQRHLLQSGDKHIDGVKTHLEWLKKQQAGTANPDPHNIPGIQVITDMPGNSFTWQKRVYHIGPESLQQDAQKIRSCVVCRGCQQHLQAMPTGLSWLGSNFTHEPGASAGWLMATNSSRARTGKAAVKVWCVPVPKPGTHTPAVCQPDKVRQKLQAVLALQAIAKDCGLDELVPNHWVDSVDGVIPKVGLRVAWDALWADLVVGVSAESLVNGGQPRVQPEVLLDYLRNKLNSTQVVMAAIFDLLFSQCDRHGQNLYFLPDGTLSLIDNDQSYGSSWRPCGIDSLFLPGTQKFEVARLGFRYVMKKPEYAPPRQPRDSADPLQLLDYRCHTPAAAAAAAAGAGGAPAAAVIGKNYPNKVKQCLRKLAYLTPQKIMSSYHYPNLDMAAALHQRASDMLHRGFEWTLKYGWPQNPSPLRYKWSKACCQMQLKKLPTPPTTSSSGSNSSGSTVIRPPAQQQQQQYECTAWRDESLGWHTDLPVGDPSLGLAWEHDGRDTGSYNLTHELLETALPVVE